MVIVFTVAVLLLVVVTVGCRDGGRKPSVPSAPFELSVDSLGITGEVDDPEVSEVDVDGEKWTVTGGEFSGTVDTVGKEKVEIRATDKAGNTAKKTIEIK